MALDLKALRKTLRVRTVAPVGLLQSELGSLSRLDADSEHACRTWGWSAGLLGFGGVAVLFAGGAMALPPLVGVGIAAVLAGLVCLVPYFRHKRTDVDNRRYELVSGVLRLIGCDLDEAPLSLALDLNGPKHKQKLVGTGKAGHWNVKYYRDPWLHLRGRLADGTTFDLTSVELFQHRSRWKRSRSGKSKYKSKTKSGFECALQLRYKPERYRHVAAVNDVEQAVQLPQGVITKGIKRGPRNLTLKAACKQPWTAQRPGRQATTPNAVDVVAMMFLSLYQVLNLSREKDKLAAKAEGK